MPNHFQDGFRTLVSFEFAPNLSFWERRVKPFGFDLGGPIDEATLRSSLYRAKSPKSLITTTDLVMTGAYNANVYSTFVSLLRFIQVITLTFPNAQAMTFDGWCDKFDPQEHVDGESPNATLTVCASNQKNAQTGYVESGFATNFFV